MALSKSQFQNVWYILQYVLIYLDTLLVFILLLMQQMKWMCVYNLFPKIELVGREEEIYFFHVLWIMVPCFKVFSH